MDNETLTPGPRMRRVALAAALLIGCSSASDSHQNSSKHPLPGLQGRGEDTASLAPPDSGASAEHDGGLSDDGGASQMGAGSGALGSAAHGGSSGGGGGSDLEPPDGGAPASDAAELSDATAEDFVGYWRAERSRAPCDAEVTQELAHADCDSGCAGEIAIDADLTISSALWAPNLWKPGALGVDAVLRAQLVGADYWSISLWVADGALQGREVIRHDTSDDSCFAIWAVRL